jgi:hypothetical protein
LTARVPPVGVAVGVAVAVEVAVEVEVAVDRYIVLDACATHGTWFDPGELESALDFVRAGGIEEEPTAEPQAQQADDPSLILALQAELSVDAMKEAVTAVSWIHHGSLPDPSWPIPHPPWLSPRSIMALSQGHHVSLLDPSCLSR